MELLLHHQSHQKETTWGMVEVRDGIQWGQHRRWRGHVRGVCEGVHMVVEGEVVGGVGTGGGVSQRRVGVGWLGWVQGWVSQGGEEEGGHVRWCGGSAGVGDEV